MYDNPILYADGTAKKEDLDRIEQKFHVKIPGEMREHYLAYNGGRPERTVFTDKNGDEYFVDLFIPVRERFKRPIEKPLELLRADGGCPCHKLEALPCRCCVFLPQPPPAISLPLFPPGWCIQTPCAPPARPSPRTSQHLVVCHKTHHTLIRQAFLLLACIHQCFFTDPVYHPWDAG